MTYVYIYFSTTLCFEDNHAGISRRLIKKIYFPEFLATAEKMSPRILVRDGLNDNHVSEALVETKTLAGSKQNPLLKTPVDVTFIPRRLRTGSRRVVIKSAAGQDSRIHKTL